MKRNEVLEAIQDLQQRNHNLLDIAKCQRLLISQFDPAILGVATVPAYGLGQVMNVAGSNLLLTAARNQYPCRSARSLSMGQSKDELYLTEYQRLTRNCLEFFEAEEADVNTGVQGRRKKIRPKQVGIRCIFCRHIPIRLRQRGNVYFPNSLKNIYQAANNMAGTHLIGSCAHIPHPMQEKLVRAKAKQDESLVGKKYWMTSSEEQGLTQKDDALWLK